MTLTPRQLEVADLLCSGLLSKEAGVQLGISEKTVLHHRQDIYALLRVHNTAQLFWWMLANRAGQTFTKAKSLLS